MKWRIEDITKKKELWNLHMTPSISGVEMNTAKNAYRYLCEEFN